MQAILGDRFSGVGTTKEWSAQLPLADSGKELMPLPFNGGWGFVQIGDDEERALFSFNSVGVVNLISNSANVGTTENNDTTLNIYQNSALGTVGFNNELGSTKNLFAQVWYN